MHEKRERKSNATPYKSKGASADFERTRKRIMESAERIFDHRGYAAGTTREIADSVGLSQATIYYYIGSKEALFRDLILEVDKSMGKVLIQAKEVSRKPLDQLRALILGMVSTVLENRSVFLLYETESRWLPGDLRSKLVSDQRAFIQSVENIVMEAKRQGFFEGVHPRVVANSIVGLASWIPRWLELQDPLTPAQIADMLCKLLYLDEQQGYHTKRA